MDQHYHPVIFQHLSQLFEAGDWDGLTSYLGSLSNSHFRTAGYIIGERLLRQSTPDVFWTVATRLILWQPKAFTVTMAKAAAPLFLSGTLSIDDSGFRRLAAELRGDAHLIDRQKLLMHWLPLITTPSTMESLFDALGIHAPRRRVDFLLRTEGLVSAFVLLRTLRFEEHDSAYITDVCRQLMRRASTLSHSGGKADSLSFNLASLLRSYFGLSDVRGTFSLALQPYELSRLDTDFEAFRRIVTKV